MNEELLAPPKLNVRVYAKIIGGGCVLSLVLMVLLAILGRLGWAQVAIRTPLVALLGAGLVWGYVRVKARSERARPEGLPWIHATVSAMGFGGIISVLAVGLVGTSWAGPVMANVWLIPAIFGITLATAGMGRRSGETLHCPNCDYEFRFDAPEAAPIRCPECGVGWLGRLLKGRKLRSPRLMAFGVGLALVTLGCLNPIFYLGRVAPYLPTSLLYGCLYAQPNGIYTTWDELATRPLDPHWVGAMTERVIGLRVQGGTEYGPARWFEAMLAAKKIPPELVERYFEEGFRAELVAPRSVRVGEPFTASLRVTRAANQGNIKLAVIFGGYAMAPGGPPEGRADSVAWGYQLQPDIFTGPLDAFPMILKADGPGEVRLRAVYWVTYQPAYMCDVAWGPDGAPVQPPMSMWFKRYEVEGVVRVK